MEQLSFAELFSKYMNDACTPEEVDQLMAMLEDDTQEAAGKELLQEYLLNHLNPETDREAVVPEHLEQRFQQIKQHIKGTPATGAVVKRLSWRRIAAAAIILILAGAGAWYWLRPVSQPVQVVQNNTTNDIGPGGSRATLQLSNGQVISLDGAVNGMLSRQGLAKVNKENGRLIYLVTPDPSATPESVPYNKLSTPRGGQYQLVLPDGTQVWLNAASSIRFPTAFTGKERKVTISGEAYFEVAPSISPNGAGVSKTPFIVEILSSSGRAGGRVEVLGTHFNINAYDDEDMVKTTLLEGKVKVSAFGQLDSLSAKPDMKNHKPETINYKLLSPGQQAQIKNNELSVINDPDINQVMGWKNGLFVFDGVDLKTVLRQLARWYDVEITYEKEAPVAELFNGSMQRNLTLQQIIQGLEAMGVHVKKDGRKLLVTP